MTRVMGELATLRDIEILDKGDKEFDLAPALADCPGFPLPRIDGRRRRGLQEVCRFRRLERDGCSKLTQVFRRVCRKKAWNRIRGTRRRRRNGRRVDSAIAFQYFAATAAGSGARRGLPRDKDDVQNCPSWQGNGRRYFETM
jgi:hypothetical protein